MSDISTLQIGMEWLPEDPGSGVARMFHGLSTHLPETGVDVAALVTGNAHRRGQPSVRAFASTSTLLPARLWKLRGAMQQLITEVEPHLIAAHFALYGLPSLTADLPLVMHFHGPWALESEAEGQRAPVVRAKSWIERAVYRKAARFIVLSEAFQSILVNQYGVSGDLVRIVPGGVDVDRFDTKFTGRQARLRLNWPQDRPVVLAVRRLVHRVGLAPLIEAMPRVIQHVPDVCLLIAGKGPLAGTLQSKIDTLQLNQHIKLLGFVPDEDLPLAYRAANVSIAPTQTLEGFGLVAVESLAAGTPVLVTPVGGLPEVVRDLSPQLIMDGASVDAIASHLTDALRGTLSLPSSDACQSFATARYHWPVIARRTREVYEEVL